MEEVKRTFRKVGILFSGGLDSTCLLLDNCMLGNDIILLSLNLVNNAPQIHIERLVRYRLLEIVKEYFPDIIIKEEFPIDIAVKKHNFTLPIPPLLLLAGACSQVRFDELQIGYVAKDCSLSYLDEIRAIWKNMMVFKEDGSWGEYGEEHEKKRPEINFPLIKEDKYDIKRRLTKMVEHNKISEELRHTVFYCESHNSIYRFKFKNDYYGILIEKCCKCPSCKTHKVDDENYYETKSNRYNLVCSKFERLDYKDIYPEIYADGIYELDYDFESAKYCDIKDNLIEFIETKKLLSDLNITFTPKLALNEKGVEFGSCVSANRRKLNERTFQLKGRTLVFEERFSYIIGQTAYQLNQLKEIVNYNDCGFLLDHQKVNSIIEIAEYIKNFSAFMDEVFVGKRKLNAKYSVKQTKDKILNPNLDVEPALKTKSNDVVQNGDDCVEDDCRYIVDNVQEFIDNIDNLNYDLVQKYFELGILEQAMYKPSDSLEYYYPNFDQYFNKFGQKLRDPNDVKYDHY